MKVPGDALVYLSDGLPGIVLEHHGNRVRVLWPVTGTLTWVPVGEVVHVSPCVPDSRWPHS